MNPDSIFYLVSPKKKATLSLIKKWRTNVRVVSGKLISKDDMEVFPIVAGIPLLQPEDDPAEWIHPLYEILFGDKAHKITKQIGGMDPKKFFDNISAYIAETMGEDGIRRAFEQYQKAPINDRSKSFIHLDDDFSPSPVPGISKSDFARLIQRMGFP